MKTKACSLFLVIILFGILPLIADAQDKSQPPAAPQSSITMESPSSRASVEQSAAVKPDTLTYQNREIVTLRGMLAGVTPEQRVSASSERLNDLTDVALRGEIKIVPVSEGFFILIGTSPITAIFPQDVDTASGKNLRQVTEEAAANLRAALLAHQEQRKVPVILRGIGLSLLGTLVFVVLVVLLWRLRTYLLNRFSRHTASRKDRYKVFGLEFHNVAMALLQTISRVLTVSLFLLLAYQWITFILRRFPYTYPWGQALRGFLWGKIGFLAQKAMGTVPDLVTVLIIFFLARLVTQAIKQFFEGIESGRLPVPGVYAETAGATRRLVNTLVWLFTLVVAYPYLPGSQSAAFKGVSVFVGLVFTLGSSGIVNHLMSGLVLVYSRAFKKGDIIRIGEQEGMVMEVGALSVKIATKKREELTIPNTVMTSSIVTNYSRISKEEGLIIAEPVKNIFILGPRLKLLWIHPVL